MAIYAKTDTPIDLSRLPKSVEFVDIRGANVTVSSTDTDTVYSKLKAIGVRQTNIDNDMVSKLADIIPSVQVACFDDSQNLSDVSALSKLNSLRLLFLNNTGIDNTEQFKDFKELQYLLIFDTYIESIKSLYELPKLTVIAANKDTKFFNDEILDIKRLKEERFPSMVNGRGYKECFEYHNGDSTDVKNYINDRFRENGNHFYLEGNCYKLEYFNSIVTRLISNKIFSFRTFDDPKLTSTSIHNLRTYSNLEGFTSEGCNSYKSLYTLLDNVRLKELSLIADVNDIVQLAKHKSAIFSEIEELKLSSTLNNILAEQLNLSDIKPFVNNTLKSIAIRGYKISSGTFPEGDNIEHIYIDSLSDAKVTFD